MKPRQLAGGPGYRTDHILLTSVDTSLVRYTEAQSAQFFQEVGDRARELPGVVGVALATSVPMASVGAGHLLAAYIPARRPSRISPMQALRHE